MVRLDPHTKGSGFREGSVIHLDDDEDEDAKIRESTAGKNSRTTAKMQRTYSLPLINPHPSLHHSSSADESDHSDVPPNVSTIRNTHKLDLDIQLENNTAVEGSHLHGQILLHNREDLLIGSAKIRVVGFEAISYDRHTFYQYSAPLESASSMFDHHFASQRNRDGFRFAKEGRHTIPFSFHLPQSGGAKGSVTTRARVNVRYIVLV